MRRTLLKLLIGVSAAAAAGAAISQPRPKADKRLLGTWRSDKERTIALWKYRKELTPEEKERFESIFGKFTLRFTESHIYTEYEGEKDKIAYSVVATDSSSVVIAWHEGKDKSLQHIHFDDHGYYILSGHNVEFYKRVPV